MEGVLVEVGGWSATKLCTPMLTTKPDCHTSGAVSDPKCSWPIPLTSQAPGPTRAWESLPPVDTLEDMSYISEDFWVEACTSPVEWD